jgi:integrase/recombinase XerD
MNGPKTHIRAEKNLPNVVMAWQANLAVRGLSPVYQKRQAVRMAEFVAFATARGAATLCDITPALLRIFAGYLNRPASDDRPPLSAEAQARRLAAVRSLCQWALSLGLLDADPTGGLRPAARADRQRQALSRRQIDALLSLPEVSTPLGLRDRAALETLYSTGLRAAELAALPLSAINRHTTSIRIERGKGGKERVVPIGKRAVWWLCRYQREARPMLAAKSSTIPVALFLTARGLPWSGQPISVMVRKYFDLIGIPVGRGAAHVLRHSMATHLIENGAGSDAIAAMLGHERGRTTARYTQISTTALCDHLAAIQGNKSA